MKKGAEPSGRALIVAFDRDRIAMSLRTNDASTLVRNIEIQRRSRSEGAFQ